MFAVPEQYQRLLVRPMVDRFLADPTAYDLCFSACVFLYHFCDVYAEHHGMSAEQARRQIEQQNPLINVVHAVSIAAKHVVVKNAKLGPYVGLMAQHAEIGSSAAFSDGSYFSDGTSFAEHGDVVRIQTPDGELYDLAFTVASLAETIEKSFL